MGGQGSSGWVADRQHGELGPGDVIVAAFRGDPTGRFIVLSEQQTMWRFRDPLGIERPMRASTILAQPHTIEQASPERRAVFAAIAHIRANDCDFLTAETVAMYSHESEELCRAILLELGYGAELVA